MTKACPIPTEAEKKYRDIQSDILQELIRKVRAAVEAAADTSRTEVANADLGMPAPPVEFFVASVHQDLFLRLCKADPEGFSGGRTEIAAGIIRNMQNIAKRWEADGEAQ